ncbi:DNA mismatch repair protein MutS [Cristinia sonorae]|uniref:DNA mismatch repair protein MutS n=1 Tax=Cristinia sonorae TaxID=1940300 RepID=A0A8K0XT21_9AGAR|nr:DNA mismatch repair protein MutS [Cristinia sonorae]
MEKQRTILNRQSLATCARRSAGMGIFLSRNKRKQIAGRRRVNVRRGYVWRYLVNLTCKLYVLEDTQESPHFDLTSMLLEQTDPNVVLTTLKAEDAFVDLLRHHMDANDGQFSLRPHKDFLPTKGCDKALSLRLLAELPADPSFDEEPSSDSEPRSAYEFMRRQQNENGDPTSQRWNAAIRLSNYASVETSPLCMGSVGALLDHLAKVRAVGELDDEGISGLEIRDIEYIALSQAMQINADALSSLQIFDAENHASMHSEKTKEGLSLFGILNSTKTSLGRALLREWFLRPSLSLAVIQGRHDAVSCFIRPDNWTITTSMHNHLRGIKNVPRTMEIMKSGKARLSDWQGIMKFAYYSVLLRDALTELSHTSGIEVVRRLDQILDDPSYKEIGSAVNSTIDWDESAQNGRICVRPHIDEELDKKKHLYHGIDEVLSNAAQQISNFVPRDYAQTLNVVYFPQLGYLICVPMLEEWRGEDGIAVLDGWSFQFSSEANVYFKSQEMRDMDHHIGDVHSAIVDKEIEIIQSLQEKILTFGDTIAKACDICAELDCLLSLAEASRAYNFTRPRMTEDTVTFIKQGRHPLQELAVDTFVPNDVAFAGGGSAGMRLPIEDEMEEIGGNDELSSIVVCTGANACGKSVYLKQVALIHYMAQIGCFVPAESAILGIVDKIFTRIQTRESVSKVQSAFMIDLNQVSLSLRNCTSRSLVLLDEFGKGTKAADGAGLFCGVLKHLVNRGTSCPRVLVATHFHDVFRDDILNPDDLPITFVHMQVLLTSSKGELMAASESRPGAVAYDFQNSLEDDDQSEVHIAPNERITYLYRVQKGLWLNSHAALCAEIFGIPRAVVRRATYVSHLLSRHEIGQLLDEEMDEAERAELGQAEDVCRRFLAWDLTRKGDDEVDVKTRLADILGRMDVDTM